MYSDSKAARGTLQSGMMKLGNDENVHFFSLW